MEPFFYIANLMDPSALGLFKLFFLHNLDLQFYTCLLLCTWTAVVFLPRCLVQIAGMNYVYVYYIKHLVMFNILIGVYGYSVYCLYLY